MKDLQELVFESEHRKNVHGILEMSQVSSKLDQLPKNTEIWVYGENDEQGTKPPHFHVKIGNLLESNLYPFLLALSTKFTQLTISPI